MHVPAFVVCLSLVVGAGGILGGKHLAFSGLAICVILVMLFLLPDGLGGWLVTVTSVCR